MAGRNMLKILYPRSQKNDLYDQMKDFVEIFKLSLGNAPSSDQVQQAADKQWDICDTLSDPGKYRECVKKAQSYENESSGIKQKDLMRAIQAILI